MSGISNQSPAILKKNTGAANVGCADGQDVQQWITAFDAHFTLVDGQIGDLQTGMMPKAGGEFSGPVVFPYGVPIQGYDYTGVIYHNVFGIGTWDGGSQSLEINPNSAIIGVVRVNVSPGYAGALSVNRVDRVTWNDSGLACASGVRVGAFLDEDDMSSNSAVALPTQQSVKAYVDNQNAAQVLGSLVLLGEYVHSGVGVAAVNFDDLDRSLYDTFIVDLANVEPGTVGQTLQLRFRIAGATQSGNDYHRSGGGTTEYSSITLSGTLNNASGNGAGACLRVTLNLYTHEQHALGVHSEGFTQAEAAGNVTSTALSGVFAALTTSTVDGVSFFMSSGTVQSGIFRIYGVKK